jgi:VanZ family protein
MDDAATPSAGSRRAWDAVALALAGLICALTLVPAERSSGPTALGDFAPVVADALRNLVLFAPLALALLLAGHRRLTGLALCAGLSAGVELLQLGVPGRIAGFMDVACNSLGAGLAILLFSTRGTWLSPPPRWRLPLRALAVSLPWAVAFITGLAFLPSVPAGLYYGGWNPEFGGMAVYPGPVLDARIGEKLVAPAGPIADSAALRRGLLAGEPIRVRWRIAESPARLAPLVIVIGPASEELALVATHGMDLVLRRWRRAADFRLEQPELTWPGALARLRPGRSADLVATPSASGVRAALDGGEPEAIDLGIGRGWALVAPDRWLDPAWHPALDALWLMSLLFPAGLWLPRGWTGLAWAVPALACLWIVPVRVGLAPTTAVEVCGALAGLILGGGIAALAARSATVVPPSTAR